ncbi:methyltransferase TYW3-domain-containing protein [Nemania sp. NC0429]|nr:methyltransferase TYW3-domain-containing protein [Nemania sp. NC0429]
MREGPSRPQSQPQPQLASMNFSRKKERILAQLAVPDAEYSDASPKGSVDAGIRELIGEINALEGFVTTSSCAGRVSVFVEGRKKEAGEEEDDGEVDVRGLGEDSGDGDGMAESLPITTTVAAVGGKGGGGAWLFVSHDPVVVKEEEEEEKGSAGVRNVLGLRGGSTDLERRGRGGVRLVHFKFEPMILHVLTASLEHAQLLLRCGLQAGFRESGAVNVTSETPIVAIRSMGLSLESLVGVQEDGVTKCTVSDDYLGGLVRIANERFRENGKRIERFRTALLDASRGRPRKNDGTEWEDAQVRRERKRAEGLRRKAELAGRSQKGGETGDAREVVGGEELAFPVNTDLTT